LIAAAAETFESRLLENLVAISRRGWLLRCSNWLRLNLLVIGGRFAQESGVPITTFS
jgi:hypothetical protein